MAEKNNNFQAMKAAQWRGYVGATLEYLKEALEKHVGCTDELEDRVGVLEKVEAGRQAVNVFKKTVWMLFGGATVAMLILAVKAVLKL